MTMVSEKLITKRNDGMGAQHLLKIFDPILESAVRETIEQLKSDVRGGTASEMSLFTGISKLICLEDLRGQFESRIKSGHKAAKEINNGN